MTKIPEPATSSDSYSGNEIRISHFHDRMVILSRRSIRLHDGIGNFRLKKNKKNVAMQAYLLWMRSHYWGITII